MAKNFTQQATPEMSQISGPDFLDLVALGKLTEGRLNAIPEMIDQTTPFRPGIKFSHLKRGFQGNLFSLQINLQKGSQ
jgi:hypothetical protein